MNKHDEDRCRCGARIVFLEYINMRKGKEIYIYKCGVCGSELEVVQEADPKRF